MQTISQAFKDILAGNHWFGVSVTLGDSTTPEDGLREDRLFSINVKSEFFKDGVPCIGSAVASDIDLTLIAPSFDIPKKAKIGLYIRVENDMAASEWIPNGVFYIDTRQQTHDARGFDVLSIHGYDAMLMAEVTYPSDDQHDYPLLDKTMVQFIADHMGVAVDSRTWDVMKSGYQFGLPVGYAMREVLGMIATAYGGNFIMSPAGQLRLVPVFDTPSEADVGQSVKSFEVAPEPMTYIGVRIFAGQDNNGEDIVYSAGSSTGNVLEASSDWGSQSQADAIYNTVKDKRYRPFQASGVRLPPGIEMCDGVTINGVSVGIYSMGTTFGRDIVSNIEAPAKEEIEHEFQVKSPSERKYERMTRDYRSAISISAAKISAEVAEEIDATNQKVSNLELRSDGISSQVSQQTSRQDALETQMTQIQQSANGLTVKVQGILDDGVDKVTTKEKHYTLDDNGLKISQPGKEVANRIDETGMYVLRGDTAMLQANNNGVIASDLTARNDLKIGHARFEAFGVGQTACFWMQFASGQNILLDSGRTITGSAQLAATYTPSSPLAEGDTYTVSLCVTPAVGVEQFAVYLSGGAAQVAVLPVQGTARQIIRATFAADYTPGKYPEDGAAYADVQIYRVAGGADVGDSTVHWCKVEIGDTPTDWSPAPED